MTADPARLATAYGLAAARMHDAALDAANRLCGNSFPAVMRPGWRRRSTPSPQIASSTPDNDTGGTRRCMTTPRYPCPANIGGRH